ncbi:MAG: hypothetical protein ABIZ36_08655 [Gemmatimonadaceae bacterium]
MTPKPEYGLTLPGVGVPVTKPNVEERDPSVARDVVTTPLGSPRALLPNPEVGSLQANADDTTAVRIVTRAARPDMIRMIFPVK